jgi:hypothetical protein
MLLVNFFRLILINFLSISIIAFLLLTKCIVFYLELIILYIGAFLYFAISFLSDAVLIFVIEK